MLLFYYYLRHVLVGETSNKEVEENKKENTSKKNNEDKENKDTLLDKNKDKFKEDLKNKIIVIDPGHGGIDLI